MPDLTTLKTKACQLAALRTVRYQASVSYKQIEKDTETMTTLLRTLNPSQNQGVTLITGGNTNNLVAHSPGTDYYTGSSIIIRVLHWRKIHYLAIVLVINAKLVLSKHVSILAQASSTRTAKLTITSVVIL